MAIREQAESIPPVLISHCPPLSRDAWSDFGRCRGQITFFSSRGEATVDGHHRLPLGQTEPSTEG